MATFIAGYINDLSAVKDNVTLRVQILRAWMQQVYVKPHITNLELIVMDEHARYKSITSLQQEEDGQFDVIGHVVACEDLDNYDKNGKSGEKKPLTLVDHECVF
ncbi:hypothetical protein Tco_0435659 [Tanacetum coccineum]